MLEIFGENSLRKEVLVSDYEPNAIRSPFDTDKILRFLS